MAKYNGMFKRFEAELIALYKNGKSETAIEHILVSRYGHGEAPSRLMIIYILRRNGVITNKSQCLSNLDCRIDTWLRRKSISISQTDNLKDWEIMKAPNLGHKCLDRIRERSNAQNPEYRFQLLSEAPIG